MKIQLYLPQERREAKIDDIMATLERAIEIARLAHVGQVDKAGADYIDHPLRVMRRGDTREEWIVGVLHDVVEDSDWTFEMLEAEGFSPEIIDALRCITKLSEDENYDDFIDRVLTNPLAMRVKLFDLEDNMDLTRLTECTDADIKRNQKYRQACDRIKAHIPFAVVRTEKWTETIGDLTIEHEKCYDAKGRVVGVSQVKYRNGENVGHFAEYVEPDGYWRGGFYDAQVGFGGQTLHEFIEGEVV